MDKIWSNNIIAIVFNVVTTMCVYYENIFIFSETLWKYYFSIYDVVPKKNSEKKKPKIYFKNLYNPLLDVYFILFL